MTEQKQLSNQSELQDFIGGFSVNEVRANDSLPKDAWEEIDDTVVREAQGPLVGVEDLRNEGLVENFNFGTTDAQYHSTNKFQNADKSISGESQGDGDKKEFNVVSNPLPVIFQDYSMSKRVISASQNGGINVQTESTAEAARSISRTIEDDLFQGDSSIQIGSSQVDGYLSQSDVIDATSGSPSTSGDWGGSPGNIFDDKNVLIERIQTQSDDNGDTVGYMGPYWLYLSNDQWNETKVADPEGDGNMTARERIQDDDEIAAVRVSQSLNDGEAVLVQPSQQVVDLAMARDIQTVTMDEDEFSINLRTFAIMAPRVKSTSDGLSGVVKADNL